MWALSWVDGKLTDCQWKPHQQRILILSELEHLKQGYEDREGWPCTTAEEALTQIERSSIFVFDGHKVLALSAVQPWFSKEEVLTEDFVGQGMDIPTVVAIMREVCKVVCLKRFTVGTRAAANGRHAGLARLYENEGLSVSTLELKGEIDE